MQLSHLLAECVALPQKADITVSGLTSDSRQVKPNDVFFSFDQTYIAQAISKGARAVIVDADNPNQSIQWQENIPLIPIYQLQSQLGHLASRFFNDPGKKLQLIGVTGTNGKTSCTQFIAQILAMEKERCGLIGTLGAGFYGDLKETGWTTPDAIALQKLLNEFVEAQAKTIAMEVSSHSIHQERIAGLAFEIGIFTNLTQDHLDYHGDMETYAAVKHSFLANPSMKHRLINIDDDYGRKWIETFSPPESIITYSTERPASIYTKEVHLSLNGMEAYLISPWGEGKLHLPLIGRFNLSNALAVLGALCLHGLPFKSVLTHLSQLQAVPGRMQMLGGKGKPLVVVDYAHTPDALEKVLTALRAHCEGKLICVFGCGGDRDAGKRPIMGKIAADLADQIIITNDNPRHEKPEDIAKAILSGISASKHIAIELDRAKAIGNAIHWASDKDCVLIAGKGAERYQQIGDEKNPFDDAMWVKTDLEKWNAIVVK